MLDYIETFIKYYTIHILIIWVFSFIYDKNLNRRSYLTFKYNLMLTLRQEKSFKG